MKVKHIPEFEDLLKQASANAISSWATDFTEDLSTRFKHRRENMFITELEVSKLELLANSTMGGKKNDQTRTIEVVTRHD